MNSIEKRKSVFKNLFIVQFLATWTANNYNDLCMNGYFEKINHPPVLDAYLLAENAWSEMINKDLDISFDIEE